ncbi:MAG: hypothetical protein CL857_02445 [Cryomorphaceae bacterium]|nr:hypothetical protein [Cryomorphaceae bacterium]
MRIIETKACQYMMSKTIQCKHLEEFNMSSVWETLSKIDVSEHTEEKNGLTYLSWAWAWGIVKKHYPKTTFTKNLYSSANNDCTLPYMIDPAGYAFVSVTVDIEGETQTEVLPVLNHANKAVSQPDSFQVNTALQRCLTKCLAFHGLGHYIYAGEDLPEGAEQKIVVENSNGNKQEVEGLSTVAEVFNTFIPECKTLKELRAFWGANKNAISALEKDKTLYDSVLKKFTGYAKTLEANEKGEAA